MRSGSDEAVLGGVLMGEGIVEIVQQPGQAPDFLVLAQMPGKGAHDRFRGQRVLDEMFFGAEFVQKAKACSRSSMTPPWVGEGTRNLLHTVARLQNPALSGD